jgi:hypothetical protein
MHCRLVGAQYHVEAPTSQLIGEGGDEDEGGAKISEIMFVT